MFDVTVPPPGPMPWVRVSKPVEDHQTVEGLVAGQRNSASDTFSTRLGWTLSAIANGPDAEESWGVVWFSYQAGPWVGLERTELVTLHTDGPDGGYALRDRLGDQLREDRVGLVETGGPFTPSDSVPAIARWREWGLGPRHGLPATLHVDDAATEVRVEVAPETPLTCPWCGRHGPPARHLIGMPMPGVLELLDALGVPLDVRGCIVDPDEPEVGTGLHCPDCRTELTPASWDEATIASCLLGSEMKPIPRCPKTFTDGMRIVWVPFGKPRDRGWVFTLAEGVRRRLTEAASGVLALRLGGSATVFVDADQIARAAGDRTGRLNLFVMPGHPPEVRAAGVTLRAAPAIGTWADRIVL